MRDINNYKRKKQIALILLVVFSAFFLGLLIYIAKHMGTIGALLLVYASMMFLWVSLVVSYEILSAKIEILKELKRKEN
ncbi:MAG: hypothetical protein PVH77_06290 [Phycisphaerales bacterium]|jgi:hypothetical protein